jgi:hypothetical protein
MSELKPCPFCGSEDIVEEGVCTCCESGDENSWTKIRCQDCGASAANWPFKKAETRWNSRHKGEPETTDESSTDQCKGVAEVQEKLFDLDCDLADWEDYLHGEESKKIDNIRYQVSKIKEALGG